MLTSGCRARPYRAGSDPVRYLQMNPDQTNLWKLRAKALDEGKRTCCLHFAREYVSAYPEDWKGWVELGDALARVSLYREADRALRKSLRLCPASQLHEVHAALGYLYYQKHSLKTSEKWLRKALEGKPSHENHMCLGFCLAAQERPHEAKVEYHSAMRLDPETADDTYFHLALISSSEGDYQMAIEYLERALDINPDYEAAKSLRQDLVELIEIISKDKDNI